MPKRDSGNSVRRLQAQAKMADLIQQGYRLGATTKTSRDYKVMTAATAVHRLAYNGVRLNPDAQTSDVYRRTAKAGDKWAQSVRSSFAKKPKVR